MDQQVSAEAAAMVAKFRDATERLRSGRLLEPPEALSLRQQLDPTTQGAAVAARLLAHDSFPAALLGLVAAALRLDARSSPDACSLALEAHSDLCATASYAAGALVVDPRGDCPLSPEALDFVTRLLRTQALQCYSRLLAAATEDVQAAGTGASLRAASIIRGAACLVICLAAAAQRSMSDGSSEAGAVLVSGAARRRQQQQQARGLAFGGELAAALCDSCVVEHLARAALHLRLRCSGEAAEVAVHQALLQALCACMELVNMLLKAGLSDVPAVSPLRGVLGGRCVRHLALLSALAALCAADGGPSYGLPEELLLGLPVFGNSTSPVDVRQRPGVQELISMIIRLSSLILELSLGREPIPTPPPGRRATVALLLRLGRLGVESGRSGSVAVGGSNDIGGGGGISNSRGSGSGDSDGGGCSSGSSGGGGGGGSSGSRGSSGGGGSGVGEGRSGDRGRGGGEGNSSGGGASGGGDTAAAAAAGEGVAGWRDEAAAEWWQLAVVAALHITELEDLRALAERVLLPGLGLGRLPLDTGS
ncbi:hypothetical protein TSOC_010570 [Tetrabaena socialis]|uniref:Uncharacterized protein n=1 Tax=Tetrabaena socialis TaxID=47790 RepID=A0A2J7ZSW1_9CHLO|nr:hypothetical protein TSOC_010570 [Tetrabaena socialis]|eukprot:PNH03356.1 hypothetical protein TSOC_010570 [Tetrabaena socialis]